MKKLTLVSLIAAAFLFTACTDDKKEAPVETNVSEVNETVAPEVNETNVSEVNETVAPEANGSEANATASTAGAVDGTTAYAACSACHGADGKGTIGGAKVLAGLSAADVEAKLNAYKAGTVTSPTAAVMNSQVAALDEATIKALAAHVATLK